jgi:hypothetical protein
MTMAFNSVADFKTWQSATADFAKLCMRTCPNPMIDDALRNGWSRSCQDVLRDAIRKQSWSQGGSLPSIDWVASVRIGNTKPDLERDYYSQHGQSLTEDELADIREARALITFRPARKDIAAGEAA